MPVFDQPAFLFGKSKSDDHHIGIRIIDRLHQFAIQLWVVFETEWGTAVVYDANVRPPGFQLRGRTLRDTFPTSQ